MDWAQEWGMQFNTKKCKVMHFGRNNAEMDYMMGGQVLEKTSEERDIGVTVTKDLKPAAQCSKAVRTAMTVLSQISRSFTYRDKKYFTALYQRYVRPHLEFSVPAWNPWLQKDIETLEKVQKRAVNMISGLQGTYIEKLEQLGMQSLESRRDEADMVLVYKILNGNCAVRREKWFEVENRGTGATTRAATNGTRIRTPIARTEKRRNFFSVRVCEKWNKLWLKRKTLKMLINLSVLIEYLQLSKRQRRWIKFEPIKTTPETPDESASSQDPDGSPRTSQQVSQVSIFL
jgi:hypothetical protein